MNRHEPPSDAAIEDSLRRAAPALPNDLRARVLSRCEPATSTSTRSTRRRRARLSWRLAAVCCVFVGQWIVVPSLDARSREAIHGAPSAHAEPSNGASGWAEALQERASLLSALMDSGAAGPG